MKYAIRLSPADNGIDVALEVGEPLVVLHIEAEVVLGARITGLQTAGL